MSLGLDMSRIALGTAGLAGLWGAVDRKDALRTIHMALEVGIQHLDTAPAYADAESLVGEALRSWSGLVPTLSTKAGKGRADSPDEVVRCYTPNAIRQSVHESLRVLGVDVIDILFLHDPPLMQDDEIAPAVDCLAQLQQQGLIRAAGIGGNYGDAFAPWAVGPPFECFMGFNRYNIVNQSAGRQEFPMLRNAGLDIWQASPLYMGLLGAKHGQYLHERPSWIPATDLTEADNLARLCASKGIHMTGLALQFVYRSPWVNRIVIGASNSEELRKTLEYLKDPTLAALADKLHAGESL